MLRIGKKISMARLVVDLYEDIFALLFVELKRALLEINHNVRSVEQGAAMMVLGAVLLFFALIAFTGTAVAIMALFLPTWLSALIVALGLAMFGIALFFSGLGHFKDFTLVPRNTMQRVEDVFREYKQVSAPQHGHVEPEAHPGLPGRGHLAQ
jgi:hypothetical protein